MYICETPPKNQDFGKSVRENTHGAWLRLSAVHLFHVECICVRVALRLPDDSHSQVQQRQVHRPRVRLLPLAAALVTLCWRYAVRLLRGCRLAGTLLAPCT